MCVAKPFVVFMETMVSAWSTVKTLLIFYTRVSQFLFWRPVGKGEDGPCGATLMKNAMMPLCCVSYPRVVPCTIWTSLLYFCGV